MESKARGYCRVLRGDLSYERGTPVDSDGSYVDLGGSYALSGSFPLSIRTGVAYLGHRKPRTLGSGLGK